MLMTRRVPHDFEALFVSKGREACEKLFAARREMVDRWLLQSGKARLIAKRAAFVAEERANGLRITRSTRMVEHREARSASTSAPVRDRRKVHPTVARHAAQFLRIVRNGGFIVSPAPSGDWRVGTRLLSPAQMLDFAISKGFDATLALQSIGRGEVDG